MNNTNKKLLKLLQLYISTVEGETGDYPELDEVLQDIVKFAKDQKQELQQSINHAESQMKSWQKGGREWFRIAYQHGYFTKKEILG